MSSDKSYVHLDHTVVFTFLALIGIFAALLSFRIITDTECKEVIMYVPNKTATTGELVYFDNKSKFAKSQEWNFGDSTETSILKSPSHIFTKPGEYEITLTLNGECVGTEYINIFPPESTFDPKLVPKISGRRNVVVGQKIQFTADVPPGTTKWEWRFGDSESVSSNERSPVHIYDKPGSKNVTLIANGDIEHAARYKINVGRRKYTADDTKILIPYNPDKKIQTAKNNRLKELADKRRRDSLANARNKAEEVKKQKELEAITAPSITDQELLKLIMNYSQGIVERSAFNPYICDKGDIPVKIYTKGNEYDAPLSSFLDLMRNKNKAVIEHMHTQLDENNCIIGLNIRGKKFGLK